jgi:hypothetical protein
VCYFGGIVRKVVDNAIYVVARREAEIGGTTLEDTMN